MNFQNKNNIQKIGIISAVGLVVFAGGYAVTRHTPLAAKLSGHTMDLTNDVGEIIIVKSKTIKELPDTSKHNLIRMADNIQADIKRANKPVDRGSLQECDDLEDAQELLATWTRMQENPYAGDYSEQIKKYKDLAAERQPECTQAYSNLQLQMDKLKESSAQVKDVVAALTREKGWAEYTPTFKYKILVTDVNGTNSVQEQTVTCLTKKAAEIMPDFMLKKQYPYAQTRFDNIESLTLTSRESLLNIASTIGSTEAVQVADQAVCKSQGYLSIIPDLEA
ncbi:hypothetical protein N8654_03450 [Synechococcus sp. AH-601-B19]|nr:hypothetical protein [Synechococcus sp. AH-601-B19]